MAQPPPDLDRVLRAIADPARRRILRMLKEEAASRRGLSASDLEARVRLSQPTVSHHMSVLKKAGLVDARKTGLWVWYRRKESAIRDLARRLRKEL